MGEGNSDEWFETLDIPDAVALTLDAGPADDSCFDMGQRCRADLFRDPKSPFAEAMEPDEVAEEPAAEDCEESDERDEEEFDRLPGFLDNILDKSSGPLLAGFHVERESD